MALHFFQLLWAIKKREPVYSTEKKEISGLRPGFGVVQRIRKKCGTNAKLLLKAIAVLPDEKWSVNVLQGGNGDNPTLSRVHFLYKMWKVNFPDVYIPKVGIIVDEQGDWNGSHSYSDSYSPVVLLE